MHPHARGTTNEMFGSVFLKQFAHWELAFSHANDLWLLWLPASTKQAHYRDYWLFVISPVQAAEAAFRIQSVLLLQTRLFMICEQKKS